MSEPDITVSQTVAETKAILAATPSAVSQAEKELLDICDRIEQTFPNSDTANKARQAAQVIASGAGQVTGTVNAVESLLKEFGIPLALAGGIKLQGSGVLIHQATEVFEGLRSAMTKHQVWLYYICGGALVILGFAGDFTNAGNTIFPQTSFGVGCALWAVKIAGIQKILTPILSKYANKFKPAPRAELVQLPNK
jgi:hypothetical protein